MRLFRALATLATFGAALAIPSVHRRHVVHEKRAAEPSPEHWLSARRADPAAVLPMRVGLAQRNLHLLEDMLMEVAHPESDNYGMHWTPAEVVDFFKPAEDTVEAVKTWLTEFGIAPGRMKMSPSKGWLEFNVTVAEAEDLLQTEYHVYTHSSGLEQISCPSYSVPEQIREHVDLITPTVHFNHVMRSEPLHKRSGDGSRMGQPSAHTGPKTNGQKVKITPNLATCDQFITPDCLRALYNVHYTPIATKKNSYGIVEFTPQAFLADDLDLFFTNFSPNALGKRPNLISIDGGVAQTQDQSFNFNGESDLDLEYAMALTNPQPITLLQAGDLVEGASFNNWLDAVDASFCTFEGGDDPTQDGIYPDPIGGAGAFEGPESCGIIKPPFVVSVSYGQSEHSVTSAYAQRQCAEYGKLGMLGTSVLYSSGDNGVASFGNTCINATDQEDPNGTRFNPGFPVTCPFVTAVGATQVNPNATVNDPESACEQVIFSGGGFSNIFAMPKYQETAVKSFLKNHPPPYTAAQFNNSGVVRAFPDLSANGANYVIGIDGEFELVFGTSASSPVVGSLITLINDARLAIGKGPVGFINPAIYTDAFKIAFNDITTGGNQGCGTPGFESTTGWDPVTGVGTPNFERLLALFLLLP
ncbi:subtilisin-like protein [Punctularia strigosozonata HHB-11173 SS5]|uniref:subtilisin-like protein n=1 Tax=Punctularia strigosozonata (strain HHB-11173) TaxID=741275 RepID=UPI000441665B|nr:subtilisin-like protein [Punctularia strigosozonata HHB-11173 SS5]EIN12224.1 subtilisin-like protein [Punctularia strigosozonata HHB-11173 SS5]